MKKMPSFLQELREDIREEKYKQRINNYFRYMDLLRKDISDGNFEQAKIYAHKSWAYLEEIILSDTLLGVIHSDEIMNIVFKNDLGDQEYEDVAIDIIRKKYPNLNANTPVKGKSKLRIQSIPCIDEYGKLCAIMGENTEIDMISQIVDYYNDLYSWKEIVDNLRNYSQITKKILDHIQEQPGILQSDLKKIIGSGDGRTISNICYYLDKYNKIERNKIGKSYSLKIKY